jgi:hypothetical protein
MPIGSGKTNSCGGCNLLEHEKGEPCTAGTGNCMGAGKYECQGMNSVTCSAKPLTPAEKCDGTDNDCDGHTDEGVTNDCGGCKTLSNRKGESCSAGVGACQGFGKYVCRGADALECDAKANTPAEVCDGRDNDCDNAVDEDIGRSGSCTVMMGGCPATGSWICRGGAITCDAQAVVKTEVCGNDVDDDCDGQIDEYGNDPDQMYPPAWFLDCDGDGQGNAEIATNACHRPAPVKGCKFVTVIGADPPQAECACLK